MAFAFKTEGQGASSYIALQNWNHSANVNTGVSGIEIEISLDGFRGQALGYLLGASSSTQNAVRVDAATMQLQLRLSAANRVASANGAIVLGQRHKITLTWDKSTTTYSFYLDDVLLGLWSGSAVTWNQIARYSTTVTSDVTLYAVKVWGPQASYTDEWDDSTATGNGTTWPSKGGTRNLTMTGYTGAENSWWYEYGTAPPENLQHHSSSGHAQQAFSAVASAISLNGQQQASAATAAQTLVAVAEAQPLNNQHQQTTGTAEQAATGTAETAASHRQMPETAANGSQTMAAAASAARINSQHTQSAAELMSVAGFIAGTSWVNTVEISNVQHRETSGSATHAFSAVATTAPRSTQQRQTAGTAEQAAIATASATASNSQHPQSAGQLQSVAGFIAATSWVNAVGSAQHKQTSGFAAQACSADARSEVTNRQSRQSGGQATAEVSAVASCSQVNTVPDKTVYIRRIKSRSITKKHYRADTRYSCHISSRSKYRIRITTKGGGHMQDTNFKQGASALLEIEPSIDNVPVAGITTQNLRANRAMWDFFKRFSR